MNQFTRHDFSPINPPTVKPTEPGWYITTPDWISCQQKATSPQFITYSDFAYWNGSIWTFSDYVVGIELCWFGLKEKA